MFDVLDRLMKRKMGIDGEPENFYRSMGSGGEVEVAAFKGARFPCFGPGVRGGNVEGGCFCGYTDHVVSSPGVDNGEE
jgi:hypothetical protein